MGFGRRGRRGRFAQATDNEQGGSSAGDSSPTGDTDAFEAVYDRFGDAILRYCQVRIDDPADAEDAAALIFSNAFAAFPPRDQTSLRSWLFAIARNVIATYCASSWTVGQANLDFCHR